MLLRIRLQWPWHSPLLALIVTGLRVGNELMLVYYDVVWAKNQQLVAINLFPLSSLAGGVV